mgnify:CR=1 FL=1
MKIRSKSTVVVWSLVWLLLVGMAQAEPPRELGSRLELFVDDYLIERLEGAYLELHRPRSAGVAIRFDQPWEGEFSGFAECVNEEAIERCEPLIYECLGG